MSELNHHVLLTFFLYAAITGVLNLLLSERSRVDAWAESHPKLAALLKLLRGLGLDPWHLVAAASLFFRGKLPGGGNGGSSSGGGGGGGTVSDPEPTRIRFDRPNDYPPDEPAELSSLAPKWRHPYLRLALVALLLVACARDVRPCSTEDLATGPLALHNTQCAAERQAKFPNTPDAKCDATPGCAALVAECDRWVEERCK